MRVEDFLPGRRTVREKEVESLTPKSGDAQGRGDASGQGPHRDGRDLIHLGDRGAMLPRNDQRVALIDRMQIEEGDCVGPLGHEARFLLALDYPAKDAGSALTHVASSFMAFASACAPSAASSIEANSRGVCEPPVERTKIMPVGTPDNAGF